jgi:hypothetical protein
MNLHFSAVIVCSFALAACGHSGSAEKEIPADAKFSAAPTNKKPGSATKELSMPPGATSLTYKGTLDPNKDAEFLIAGQQGTVFMTHALTPEHDLDIEVYRADTGDRITDEQPSNPNFFMARLPATLGYLVIVRSTSAASPYTLEIETPFKLFFDEARSIAVTNSAPANAVVEYLAPPSPTITAELTSAPADAYLTVHALDGRRLLKAEANSRTFTGGAGKPGEGVVISVNQGATSGDFTLRVREK